MVLKSPSQDIGDAFDAADDNTKFILKLKKDFRGYCAKFMRIQTKAGTLIPFTFNHVQDRIYEQIDEQQRRLGYVRALILKPRQTGITTMFCSLNYRAATLNPNHHAVIIADNMDNTKVIFQDKVIVMHEEMPEALRPATRYSTKRELDFRNPSGPGGLRSSLRLLTAGSDRAGQSRTIRSCHGSEVAYWDNAESVDLAIQNAMPSEEDGMQGTWITYESTANGEGNMFHRLWFEEGTDWLKIFIPWYWVTTYERKCPDETYWKEGTTEAIFKHRKADMAYWEDDKELAEEEVQLATIDEMTPRKLCWRRWVYKNKCASNINRLHQEYPTTDIEAFLSSGSPYVSRAAIQWHARLKPKCEPVVGEFRSTSGRGVKFIETFAGSWTLTSYERGENDRIRAVKGHNYFMGADSAEGIDVGLLADTRSDPDYSACYVGDLDDDCSAAAYRFRSKPDEFAKQLVLASRFFNNAMVLPEDNSKGYHVLQKVKGKIPVFVRHIYDKRYKQKIDKLGWSTDRKSRQVIIDCIEEEVRLREHHIYCKRALSEIGSLYQNPNGKVEAMPGTHDDMAVAFGLAMIVRNHSPRMKLKLGQIGKEKRDKRSKRAKRDDAKENVFMPKRRRI